jgi:lipopolysaccharide transport system permease protein
MKDTDMSLLAEVIVRGPDSREAVSLNPLRIAGQLWRQRQLIRQLTNRAVQQRFRGSALGLLWAILNPIFMLLIYTYVFGIILGVKWNGQGSHFVFAINLYCGLIVYGIFSESVGAASTQVISNTSYVKKIVFPLEILPVASMGAAVVFNLFSLAILLFCTQFFFHPLTVELVALPVIWIPLFLFTAGLSWIVASLGVFLRDIGQLVIIILQALFYLCPIVYPLSRVPAPIQAWDLRLNPLTVFVEESRRVILEQSWPVWGWLPLNYLVCVVVFVFGYYAFMKTKRGFADVI